MLWTKKYKPLSLEQVAVNKKKKTEFMDILQDQRVRVVIIQGQSGSCKNTLIDLACQEMNYDIDRYVDTKSAIVTDTYGERKTLQYDDQKWYPDDLDNLLGFINLQKL